MKQVENKIKETLQNTKSLQGINAEELWSDLVATDALTPKKAKRKKRIVFLWIGLVLSLPGLWAIGYSMLSSDNEISALSLEKSSQLEEVIPENSQTEVNAKSSQSESTNAARSTRQADKETIVAEISKKNGDASLPSSLKKSKQIDPLNSAQSSSTIPPEAEKSGLPQYSTNMKGGAAARSEVQQSAKDLDLESGSATFEVPKNSDSKAMTTDMPTYPDKAQRSLPLGAKDKQTNPSFAINKAKAEHDYTLVPMPSLNAALDADKPQKELQAFLQKPIAMRNLGLRIYGGTSFFFSRYNSTNLQALPETGNVSSSPVADAHIGASVLLKKQGFWSVYAGAEYNKFVERFDATFTWDTLVQIPGQTMPLSGRATRSVRHFNELETLTIPVEFVYTRDRANLTYGFGAGLAYSLVLQQAGRNLIETNQIGDFSSQTRLYNGHFNLRLSPFIGYRFTDHVALTINTTVSHQIHDAKEFTTLKHRTWAFMPSIGLVLNKKRIKAR